MVGQRFGNYQATALLGEGGMGAVYLAHHPTIGRRVAIKVLRTQYATDETALARFVNEARAANAIRHPNIIEILDSGTTPDGLPYLVMELLEGESLRARLRRMQRLPIDEAIDFAYVTASALAAAHARGIVHRDLKPDNLFVVADPGDPRLATVKVLDFGIAKLQPTSDLNHPDTPDSLRTRTGAVMGTPTYMSPEQCLGNREVDARSDVYALGVMLYEMVCGHPPFRSQGFGELVHMHINLPPPPPRTIAPDVPPALEAIILRALAKPPEARFASMENLMGALESAAGHWLAERRKAARQYMTVKLPASALQAPAPRRRSWAWLAAFAGLGAIALAAALFAPPSGPPAAARVPPPIAIRELGPGGVAGTEAPATTPAPATANADATVKVEIASQPAGAQVIRTSDGVSLGVTPFSGRLPLHSGPLVVRLEKPGFSPAERTIGLDDDARLQVALDPVPRKRPVRARPPARHEPSKM